MQVVLMILAACACFSGALYLWSSVMFRKERDGRSIRDKGRKEDSGDTVFNRSR